MVTALIPGWEFDFTFASGLAVGAGCALVLVGHALHDTRRVSLRRLWHDWQKTSRQ